jgi:hypothetical protein
MVFCGASADLRTSPCTLVEHPIAKCRKVVFTITESSQKLPTTKMPSTHKKEKPWDTDDIDKWKVRTIIARYPIIVLTSADRAIQA